MDNLRGALLMVLAMAGFAIEDSFVKYLSLTLSVGHILMLFGLGGTAVFATIALVSRDRLFPRDALRAPLLLRNLGELLAALSFVTALSLADLSVVSAILQAQPLAITLAAALFLGETVGWRRWSAIAIGFAGVLLIIRPGLSGFTPVSLLPVIAVFALALRDLATRFTPATVTSRIISAYGFATLVPAGVGLCLVTGEPLMPPDFPLWAFVLGIGFGCAGYYGVVAAMRVGEVSFVSPFRYSRLLFALILGIVVFAERPDLFTYLGSALIIGSGIYTILRERRLARRGRTRIAGGTAPLS
ncbi:DMT family transporter [Roseovarius sp. SCSIO 43702]|uniref:DMT family transporter n=1 Tax=Roseovarius sp. SCSIO 43702 TaxID=2823043 RepID=UPI001C738D92|nr:DMT family transporter [Roseovarius sp. SCSIO 43702]QYX55242.1 DMT family transporter [Roseovarius sp. SCSIO 43702]